MPARMIGDMVVIRWRHWTLELPVPDGMDAVGFAAATVDGFRNEARVTISGRAAEPCPAGPVDGALRDQVVAYWGPVPGLSPDERRKLADAAIVVMRDYAVAQRCG